jgi:hypothetical protein
MIGALALSPAGDAPVRSRAEMIAHLERCNEADRRMIAGRLAWCREARKRVAARQEKIDALRRGMVNRAYTEGDEAAQAACNAVAALVPVGPA